jgi:protein TonB
LSLTLSDGTSKGLSFEDQQVAEELAKTMLHAAALCKGGPNQASNPGAYAIGGSVSAPSVLSRVEPEYSEEARKAKWQGTVVLTLVVDEHGLPQAMKVTRSLGLGLDQKAIEAVSKWRFKPGMKDGKPVPVIATIEVTFRCCG